MSVSAKRKREPRTREEPDYASQRQLGLDAHEAVIWPANEQRPVKLSDSKHANINASGLIEWSVDGPQESIWVDRLLLDSLPSAASVPHIDDSEIGWEDLPSDAEDIFYFSREEVEETRRRKRRRKLDDEREARLAAIKLREPVEPVVETWASDEEPDEVQLALMKKTAAHIVSSPSPVQLEMRILANHGGDARFAFLRGRWKRVWNILKSPPSEALPGVPATQPKTSTGLALAYAESDEEEDEDVSKSQPKEELDDKKLKAERLARVKEWARQRKEAKLQNIGTG